MPVVALAPIADAPMPLHRPSKAWFELRHIATTSKQQLVVDRIHNGKKKHEQHTQMPYLVLILELPNHGTNGCVLFSWLRYMPLGTVLNLFGVDKRFDDFRCRNTLRRMRGDT
jgi:hypothetical protein